LYATKQRKISSVLYHTHSLYGSYCIYIRKTTKTITRTAVVGVPNYGLYGGSDGGGSGVVGQNQSNRGNGVPVLCRGVIS